MHSSSVSATAKNRYIPTHNEAETSKKLTKNEFECKLNKAQRFIIENLTSVES